MMSYLIVLLCFLVSFILHFVAHRYVRMTVQLMVALYIFGAVLLYASGRMGYISLPWSSGFLYILLSCTSVLWYIPILLGTELPTSIILASFRRKKQQTFDDLILLFTDRGLIFNRLDGLIQSKLVEHRGNTLNLTPAGIVVWQIMEFYRRIFHRLRTE